MKRIFWSADESGSAAVAEAPKARKARAAKKGSKPAKKKVAKGKKAPKEKGELSTNKRLILETLNRNSNGLTRAQLAEKTEITKGWAKYLGAATKGDPEAGTLEGDGLVKSQDIEGTRGMVYTITAAGRKAVGK